MKTFRQHFQHLQERAHPTSQATPVLPGDELAFDPDEYLQTRYGDPDSRFDNLTSTELPQVDIPQFDRLTKSAEFDFRKGIVEPEADTDTKLMVDPNPYTQSWGGKFSVDQPNGEPAPGRTRWEYVPNTDAKDNTRWVPSSEADSIASWKANNPGKSDLDWGTPPAAAPALDTTKPNAKYKFNRNTQQQELDTAPDNQSITWRDIYRLNKKTIGSDPGRIKPGQVLKMPNGAPDYTVQTGDTLSKIAGQNSSDAAPVKRPERPITPTPDNKDSQPRRVRTPTPGNIQPLVTPLTGLYVPPNQNFTGQTGKDKEEIVTPELTAAKERAAKFMADYDKKLARLAANPPGNIQPKQTAIDGFNFPPNANFGLGKGEELVRPKKWSALDDKLGQDMMARATRMGAEREAERQKNQAAKKSADKPAKPVKEGSPGFIKHLRDYIVEVETAPAFTPNQTMDPQQAAAANKAAQDFVAQLTAKLQALAATAPVQEAQLNEGWFDSAIKWAKDALDKNPLIEIGLRLIPATAAVLAALDVVTAVKSGDFAQAGKALANMIPGGQQVAQAIGIGQAVASGDVTGAATGIASAAIPMPKIAESELDRILALARHSR